MSIHTFLILWAFISIPLILGLFIHLYESGKYIETFDWEKEKHHFFPYNWPDSATERRKAEKIESIERMQRQLWYKEFFKD